MSRTTSELVEGILLDNYGPDECLDYPDLHPFVIAASSLVDDVVECAAAKGITLSDSKLEVLERWLGAHFYQQSDRGIKFKKTQDASNRYDGETKMYLESTMYGQMAVTLDPSGCLAAIADGERKSVNMVWLGKRPSQQINIMDRS